LSLIGARILLAYIINTTLSAAEVAKVDAMQKAHGVRMSTVVRAALMYGLEHADELVLEDRKTGRPRTRDEG
jgi:hypothetical protein